MIKYTSGTSVMYTTILHLCYVLFVKRFGNSVIAWLTNDSCRIRFLFNRLFYHYYYYYYYCDNTTICVLTFYVSCEISLKLKPLRSAAFAQVVVNSLRHQASAQTHVVVLPHRRWKT